MSEMNAAAAAARDLAISSDFAGRDADKIKNSVKIHSKRVWKINIYTRNECSFQLGASNDRRRRNLAKLDSQRMSAETLFKSSQDEASGRLDRDRMVRKNTRFECSFPSLTLVSSVVSHL